MGNQFEGGEGSDKTGLSDRGAARTEQIDPERNPTGAQIKEVQATNPDNCTSMTDMKGPSRPLTTAEINVARAFDSFGIDMGDGTVQTAKGAIEKRQAEDGYLEPGAAAKGKAQKQPDHWNPSKGLLNPLEPSSWSKLQQYAGVLGRAHGWESKHRFDECNALRHALASAYIGYHYGAASAMAAGDWHELQTSIGDIWNKKPWSSNPQDIKDWKDHGKDINNNLAGAKIGQTIRDKGGSWQDVEKAVVDSVQHLGKDGRIPQPNVRLYTFLDR